MASFTFISNSFEDAAHIVDDLLPKDAECFGKDAIGFLYCDPQTDYDAVIATISAKVPFPVIGGTTMTFPFAGKQENDTSASFTILEKEGMVSSIVVSEPLSKDNHKEVMRLAYEGGLKKLGSEPKAVIVQFPFTGGLPIGDFIEKIFLLAGDVPVFGGASTSDLIYGDAMVFAEGKAVNDRMILIMLGGSVRPVFATSNTTTPMVEYTPVVTESSGNEVLRIDGETFCDYMRTIGFSPEKKDGDVLMEYSLTPVIIHPPEVIESDVPEIRCINFINNAKGSATFSGPVPEGARLRMSILRKQDVEASAEECLKKLTTRMKIAQDEGYTYSTLICVTCAARYFVLADGPNIEQELLTAHKPEGLSALGYYAFCEIGPAYASDDGSVINRSHNSSIVLCAI